MRTGSVKASAILADPEHRLDAAHYLARLDEDDRATGVRLELCTMSTPECPHFGCPDGWHPGDSPNCSCTPDCALADDEEEE